MAQAQTLTCIKTAAQYVGIHPESLRRLARRKPLPGFVKVGGQWRVNLDKFLGGK